MDARVPDPQGIRSGTVAAMQKKGGIYMLICLIPSPKSLFLLADACKQIKTSVICILNRKALMICSTWRTDAMQPFSGYGIGIHKQLIPISSFR